MASETRTVGVLRRHLGAFVDPRRTPAQDLHSLLSSGISLDQAHNSWELRIWKELLSYRQEQRSGRGTLKWWAEVIKEVGDFRASPIYQAPELPDIRAELRADLDKALDDPDSLTNQFNNQLDGDPPKTWMPAL